MTEVELGLLGEAYAYDRWPEQTVRDDSDLIALGISTVRGWADRAGIEVTP